MTDSFASTLKILETATSDGIVLTAVRDRKVVGTAKPTGRVCGYVVGLEGGRVCIEPSLGVARETLLTGKPSEERLAAKLADLLGPE